MRVALAWTAAFTSLVACAPAQPLGRKLVAPADVSQVKKADSPYLKAHMRDGRLYVLSSWNVNDAGRVVAGHGRLLEIDRHQSRDGDFQMPSPTWRCSRRTSRRHRPPWLP